jgi:hypothetical protein
VAVLFVFSPAVTAGVGSAASGQTSSDRSEIALGAPLGERDTPRYLCLVTPRECGWGTAAPRYLTLGGDASGTITDIRWKSWGGPVATGEGLNEIFRPQGGYYPEPVVSRLRAYDVGQCAPRRTMAYRRLVVREPKRPGGRLRVQHIGRELDLRLARRGPEALRPSSRHVPLS